MATTAIFWDHLDFSVELLLRRGCVEFLRRLKALSGVEQVRP